MCVVSAATSLAAGFVACRSNRREVGPWTWSLRHTFLGFQPDPTYLGTESLQLEVPFTLSSRDMRKR